MPSVQMEGVCYSVFIFAVSLFFYWKIHWRRLDYSLDTSFFGFFNTATMKNESSRVHASLGLAVSLVNMLHNYPASLCLVVPSRPRTCDTTPARSTQLKVTQSFVHSINHSSYGSIPPLLHILTSDLSC